MRFRRILAMVGLGLVVAAFGSAPAAIAQGDPLAGQKVFERCGACHSLVPGENKVGPSLAGVIGRTAGTQPGFRYSVVMRRSGVVWTPETLDKFIEYPWEMMHGTAMLFTGLSSKEDRANVIAYLRQVGERGAPAAAAPATPPPGDHEAHPTRNVALPSGYTANVRYTLKSGIAEGRMVYIGVGGEIDGVINPPLAAEEGDIVQVTLINGEGAEHDIVFHEQNVRSQHVVGKGASTTVAFRARAVGDFIYFCSLPGHREAGMEGKFVVRPRAPPPRVAGGSDISLDPAKVPPPIARKRPATVQVELTSIERAGRLADGSTYAYWTFNGTVPGPFIRVRVGDTVEVTLKNDRDSSMMHSVDFHAATGPGGGAEDTQVEPGGSKKIAFKALRPGLYVYHCATPLVAHHIANGMYGLILVEPEGGLPPVDHEFYVMQGEIYTEGTVGQQGMQEFSIEKLLNERPEYFVFNGNVGALTTAHPLRAKVGETVRIFFGVGGPNFTSSFHVIGEIFDRVYTFGDLVSPAARAIQTVSVPPGGSVVTEFTVDYPGRYLLVDHALSRTERGLVGFLEATGKPDPSIYRAFPDVSEGRGSEHRSGR